MKNDGKLPFTAVLFRQARKRIAGDQSPNWKLTKIAVAEDCAYES